MVKMRKFLADSTKARRNRRYLLNIQITIFTWLVEFILFFGIFIGMFIVGQDNSNTSDILYLFTLIISFIILPSMILFSGSHLKSMIVDCNWYLMLINTFDCQPSIPIEDDDDNEGANNQIQHDEDNEGINIHTEENIWNLEHSE